MEGLAVNGHLSAKHLLSRRVREAGVRVLLTGEGADEVFAGYAHLRDGADDPLSRGIMLPEGPGLPLGGVRDAIGFVPRFLEAKAALGLRLRGLLDPDFAATFAGRDVFREFVERYTGALAGRHRLDQSLYLWCKSALATYILRTLGDGTEMAHGVEGRLPFLDHPLFEFARAIPPEQKIRDGVEKHILREAVRPLVPEEVYRRRKQPFFAPPIVLDVAVSPPPFFDRGRVRRFLDGLTEADAPALMMVLSAAHLHQRFGL